MTFFQIHVKVKRSVDCRKRRKRSSRENIGALLLDMRGVLERFQQSNNTYTSRRSEDTMSFICLRIRSRIVQSVWQVRIQAPELMVELRIVCHRQQPISYSEVHIYAWLSPLLSYGALLEEGI